MKIIYNGNIVMLGSFFIKTQKWSYFFSILYFMISFIKGYNLHYAINELMSETEHIIDFWKKNGKLKAFISEYDK